MVKIKDVCFGYGDELVINRLNLEVKDGEILSIIGPSGCGKSTVLRLIAGLETPSSGEILTSPFGDHDRDLRFLFQDYDAFPWFTTWENVKRSASKNNYPSDDEVGTILQRVGLLESRNKYPGELSGGMRKRLALARCLVNNPRLLLLDEPFSKLDVDTRYEMYAMLQELWMEFNQTIVQVTHDLHEAILLGTRILVATHLPFRVRTVVEVPFRYPRTDSVTTSEKYLELTQRLRLALRLKDEVKE